LRKVSDQRFTQQAEITESESESDSEHSEFEEEHDDNSSEQIDSEFTLSRKPSSPVKT